jgi:threonine dehydrogenase-like Zn-dependent dehydrogenase
MTTSCPGLTVDCMGLADGLAAALANEAALAPREDILMESKGLFGKKFLDIQERVREIPPPGEEQVIVRVRACGVCGTDINFVRDWDDAPMALGHEISAEVVEVGKNVTTVQPGDRVIVEDCTMCGVCEDCKSGQPQFCRQMYNIEGQPGMGQYLCVRFNSLVPYQGLDHPWHA